MDLFVSQFKNKIDKKGRISLPSLFRNALPKGDKNQIILFKNSWLSNAWSILEFYVLEVD